MKAKIRVSVDRDAALAAIRTLDALGVALLEHEAHWPKKLRSRYEDARRDLVRAVGSRAHTSGVADLALFD
jgi:hypothetical protein